MLDNESTVIDQIALIRSPSKSLAARSDLLLASIIVAATGALAIFPSGGNEKYYLLASIIFQLFAVISIGLTRKVLQPANMDAEIQARLDALDSRPPLHPGVPGRIGMVAGYILLFLLACTLLVQKNDAGNNVDAMVHSLSFALPGIGMMIGLTWLLGILRINANFWRYVVAIVLGGVMASYLYSRPSQNFEFMILPVSWFIAGIIIGICFTGLWDLLWPLMRWKSRTTTRVLAIFLIAFIAFANGLESLNISARDTQIYAYILFGVLGLCVICGIISVLCILVAKRGAKRGTQVIIPAESSNA